MIYHLQEYDGGPLRIRGELLDYALSQDDYEVEIGQEYCEVVDLTNNQITCTPPQGQPATEADYVQYNGNSVPHVKVLH